MLRREESGRELRKIQRFREWRSGAPDAGRSEPAWDAGRDPQERGSGQATILLARRALTIKRWSLDARSEGRFACPLLRR